MPWTQDHQDAALKEGWGLFTVVDSGTTRPYLKALPEGDKFRNAEAVGRHLTAKAKTFSQLHIDAMKEVMASFAASKPKRKK